MRDCPLPRLCFWNSLVVAMLLLSGGALQAQETRSYVNPSPSDGQGPPFSGAVWIGSTLYLSGTIGRNADGQIPDTPEEEARLVLNNVQRTLDAAGLTMDDLVTVTVYCSDVAHYDAFNSVYRTYFDGDFPARAFIGAGTLLFNARFEVQGIAAR